MNSPTIDTFNRANENPIASPWANLDTAYTTELQIISSEAAGVGSGIQAAYHTETFTDATQEFWIKLGTVATSPDFNGVIARIQNPGGSDTWGGYLITIVADSVALRAVVNGALGPAIDSNPSVTFAAGDIIGVRCEGNVIRAIDASGMGLLAVTDTTYPYGGYGGIATRGSAPTIDEFGGGTYSVSVDLELSTVTM